RWPGSATSTPSPAPRPRSARPWAATPAWRWYRSPRCAADNRARISQVRARPGPAHGRSAGDGEAQAAVGGLVDLVQHGDGVVRGRDRLTGRRVDLDAVTASALAGLDHRRRRQVGPVHVVAEAAQVVQGL